MAEMLTIPVNDYPATYGETEHVLVDVREVDEYTAGHLPGAINVPLSIITENTDKIPKDVTVLLVCQHGGRSQRAAEYLNSLGGYVTLVNLDGGTHDWAGAGNPIER
jgi:rhodanese-related sulfurtransferase